MASTINTEEKAALGFTPFLPSLALPALCKDSVQGESMGNMNNDENVVDTKGKTSKRHRRFHQTASDNRPRSCHLNHLFCGCLSSQTTSESATPKNLKERPYNQDEKDAASADDIVPSAESHNATFSSSSAPHNDGEDVSLKKNDDDRGRMSFFSWSPFSKLRFYFSKRAHKSRGVKSDISNVVTTFESRDVTEINELRSISIKPKPLDGDLNEQKITLLGTQRESDRGKKCFIIDLDETLVHSSFKAVDTADFKVGVEIDNMVHQVYVLKRPHVDEFLQAMSKIYECVLFTASLSKYADPVADFLDKWQVFRYRLFRESCVYHRGNYVKDLSQLGRPIEEVVILDNSPASYMFHATHAVQITSWFDDKSDRALLELIPYFQRLAAGEVGNVVDFLRHNPPPAQYAVVGSFDTNALNSIAVGASRSVQTTLASNRLVAARYHEASTSPFSSPITSVTPPPTTTAKQQVSPATENPISSVLSNDDVPDENAIPSSSKESPSAQIQDQLEPANINATLDNNEIASVEPTSSKRQLQKTTY